jgi:hypothetical protein
MPVYKYFTNNVKNMNIGYYIMPPMNFAQNITIANAVKYLWSDNYSYIVAAIRIVLG